MRKGLKGLLLILIVVGLSFLVFAHLGGHLLDIQIGRVTPLPGQNFVGSINLNVTILANGTHGRDIVNVSFRWYNMTGTVFNSINQSNITANQTNFGNGSFNTLILPDGKYNLTVWVYNVSGGVTQIFIGYAQNSSTNITIDNTPPNVTINLSANANNLAIQHGSNFSVRSSNKTFSATIFDIKPAQVDNASKQFEVDSVYFWFDNGTGLDFNISGINNSGQWSVSYNVSVLAEERNQLVRIMANDTMSNGTFNNLNNSVIYNFTVDRTSPNVTFNIVNTNGPTIQFGHNYTVNTGNRTFNVSVIDNVTVVDSVIFVFDNGTGTDFNITGINNSGQWTVSYNVSSLSGENAAQTVRVFANDTVDNRNNSVFFNFTVDRTNPKVTVTSSSITSTAAKISASTNESVLNCTYSVTNGGGSGTLTGTAPGSSFSATLVLLPSNDYTASVTCGDFVGNQGTGAASFTSSASAATTNGGGGAGGSSGGASTGVQGQYEKKVWTSINAGETASVALKNGAVGVTEVSISVPQTVYGAWISVTKRDTLPSSVSAFEGKVYRTVDIAKGPALAKEGAFTDATIKFKVEKAWLAGQQLTKEAVALHRYENGAWVQLQTQVGEDDGTYVHYSAKTPDFSYFVIGQKSGAAAAPTEAAPVEAPAEEAAEEAAAAEEPAMMEKKGLSKGLLLALLAAAVVVVAVVLYMRKKR